MSPISEKRQAFKGIALPHIGGMLRKFITDNRFYQSSWARKQGIKPETIAKYFKKSTMQLDTVFTICQVLNYNFIREIADALPADMPPHRINPLQDELNAANKEIERLNMKIEIMEGLMKK